jgi:hypothetical protein
MCSRFAVKSCAKLAQKRVKKKSILYFLKLPNSREITFSKEGILKKPLGSKIGNKIEQQQASEAIHGRICSF